ncbi:MAG: EscU/YscU/HrcU family type III secretion system export apparatus switch protein [Deltaproteobacteria bacterium]|nr:EscU/YscU/HrcU family type III secretion system export apparatus switch protein [Deltaproteobacteria bacterium]
MSEARRHPPSARRLRQARREGRVPVSPEPAGLLGVAALLMILGPGLAPAGRRIAALWPLLLSEECDPAAALAQAASTLLALLLPWLALLGLGGWLAGLAQSGGHLGLHALRPRLERLSPAAGWRRLFGLDRLAGPLRGLLLVLLALPLFGRVFAAQLPTLAALPRLGGEVPALGLLPGLARPLLWTGLGLAALSALGDTLWRRHRHQVSLRMSDRELREEARQDTGDPRARQERRGRHRQMTLAPAPPLGEAKVVVLNPTHLAVAIHHDHLDALPYLGRRATGLAAARVRAEARRARVPMLRDRHLARALMRLDPGEEIPAELFAPVAALLSSVYRAGLAPPPGGGERKAPAPSPPGAPR